MVRFRKSGYLVVSLLVIFAVALSELIAVDLGSVAELFALLCVFFTPILMGLIFIRNRRSGDLVNFLNTHKLMGVVFKDRDFLLPALDRVLNQRLLCPFEEVIVDNQSSIIFFLNLPEAEGKVSESLFLVAEVMTLLNVQWVMLVLVDISHPNDPRRILSGSSNRYTEVVDADQAVGEALNSMIIRWPYLESPICW